MAAEKGKIIQVNFDGPLKQDSLPDNETAFAIIANEALYVPGIDPVSKQYIVEETGPAYIRAEKKKIEEGILTNVAIDGNNLRLDGGPTERTVGRTSGSSNYTAAKYGIYITITKPNTHFKQVTFKSASSTSANFVLVKTSSWYTYLKQFTSVPVNAWGDTVITIDYTFTQTGTYYLGMISSYGANAYYMSPDNNVYSDTTTGVTTQGGVYNSGPAAIWAFFYSPVFSVLSYEASGNWLYALPVDVIKNLTLSLIQWSETTPDGTMVAVKTALTTDGETPPDLWNIETNEMSITSISINDDLTSKFLWIKIDLTTTDAVETPLVEIDTFLARARQLLPNSMWVLISGWAGFNKALGNITVEYNSSLGTIAGSASGYPQLEDFSKTFTPEDLNPVNNPGVLEVICGELTDLLITRTVIDFEKTYPQETINTELKELSIVRIHIDDIDP